MRGRSAGNLTNPLVTTIPPAFVLGRTASFPNSRFGFGTVTAPPLSNLQEGVDAGEAYSTLAVVLQYEGVADLAGITAALKLPAGFKAECIC
jgi:hypothetical protein